MRKYLLIFVLLLLAGCQENPVEADNKLNEKIKTDTTLCQNKKPSQKD